MTLRECLSWTALFGASFGLHAVGFAKLNHMGGQVMTKVSSKPAFMEMTSVPKPSAPKAELAPPADRPAPRAARRLAAVAPKQATPPAVRPAAAPPPAAETIADFSGTTLTNDGSGAPAPRPAPPAVVAVADLSRRPEAPRLEEALERNYPAEARQGGLSGRAVVRARITPAGEVRDIFVQSESNAGFGRACRDTLAGSHWTPPLDRDGHPVATIINYTCRFEVR
jgi:TonB family protein